MYQQLDQNGDGPTSPRLIVSASASPERVVAPDPAEPSSGHETLNVLQLGLGFFFIFLAFNSQGFIEQSVLDSAFGGGGGANHDGYTSLAIVYASFTLLNFAAAPIVSRIGPRWSLVFGALAYALFEAGFLFLNRWYLFASSALLGLGAAVIWTAQGNFLALNSPGETAGKHSNLFWACFQACQVCGGLFLLLVFLLQQDDQQKPTSFSPNTVFLLYGAFTAVTLVGTVILAFLRVPSEQNQRRDTSEQPLEPVLMPVPTEEAQKPSHLTILKSTLRLALTRQMALFSLPFMYTGIVLSFWSSIYPTSIVNTELFQLNHGLDPKVLLALNAILQGLGQTSSGFLFGILGSSGRARMPGRNKIVLLGALLHLAAFAGIFANIPPSASLGKTLEPGQILNSPSVFLALFCGFLLGFGDACWNTQIYALLIAKYPKERSAQAFCLFKFFQSLLTCAVFFCSSALSLDWHLLFLILGCLVAMFAFALVERMPRDEGEEGRHDYDD